MEDQDKTALIDIVSNLLGALILMSCLMLVTQGMVEAQHNAHAVVPPTDLRFRMPPRPVLRPLMTVYVVRSGQVAALDLTRLSDVIASADAPLEGALPESGLRFSLNKRAEWRDLREANVTPDAVFSDINEYDISIEVDENWFTEKAWMTLDDLMAMVTTRRTESRYTLPLFMVYRSGFGVFTQIRSQLELANVRYRWLALKDEEPIRLYRNRFMFQKYNYRG